MWHCQVEMGVPPGLTSSRPDGSIFKPSHNDPEVVYLDRRIVREYGNDGVMREVEEVTAYFKDKKSAETACLRTLISELKTYLQIDAAKIYGVGH